MSLVQAQPLNRAASNIHPVKPPDHNAESGDSKLIELCAVAKTFHSPAGEFPVLRGVDMAVMPGEFIAIVGKSGCGKTTLINMIAGIDRPSSGEVWINGTAVHEMPENHLARWRGRFLGVVFQFYQLLPTLTLAQNVMLPIDFCTDLSVRQARERAMQLLALVGLTDHADKLPSAVSGGEQQRAAIARALANDPPLLLADEPTGNLDAETAASILDLFSQINREGKTIIMVTHDATIAGKIGRRLRLAGGQLDGQIAEVHPPVCRE